MNRTTATCIAGTRSKTTTGIKTHFQRRLRPREAEPFTRRVFVLVLGIFAKRLQGLSESEASESGMKDKAREYSERGVELYART